MFQSAIFFYLCTHNIVLVTQTYHIENQRSMKTLLITLTALAFLSVFPISAQSISYSYDRSGNRVGRKSSSPNKVKTKDHNVTNAVISSNVNAIYNSISKNIEIIPRDFLCTPIRVSVYSASGQMIYNSIVPKERVTIDASSFAVGIYLVEVECGETKLNRKITIK